jgi:glycosyltransferase involved in cell wall biosynthesis
MSVEVARPKGSLSEKPVVTIVVPMLNELGFVEACLRGFEDQVWPAELLNVVVVDGGSTDGSREIVDHWAATRDWVRVIDNPARCAAAAFNRGIEVARGEVLCLFSAHGVPSPEYVSRSVEVLSETDAVGVGGAYLHIGLDRRSSAIGLAMVSPFGMASPHRSAATRTEVDTISHPAYRIEALHDAGPFDESMLRNEDYEMNWRLRQRGGRLLVDPTVSSIYRPRPTLRALGRQFFWYGRFKARLLRDHPGSTQPRHLVPPAAVLGAIAWPLLFASHRGRPIAIAAASGYLALLVAALRRSRPERHDASGAVFVMALPVMHMSWGLGVLVGAAELVGGPRRRSDRR